MNEQHARILVVDDEPQIRRFLRVALTAHGYDLEEAVTGEEGLIKAATERPDLIILDLGLPDQEGTTVLRRLREWSKTPVVILSVKEQEADKVAALDTGADDYVTKPFGLEELLARIRVALRHAAGESDEPILDLGDLVIDRSARLVKVGGQPIKLTPTEYEILRILAANQGRVVTNKQLLSTVWGPGCESETQYLRVYIGQLRRKIETNSSCPAHILTESGVGYRLT